MPFCILDARRTLVHDVNEDVMQIWGLQPWNEDFQKEAKPLQLTFGDTLPDSIKANTKQVRKYLVRGTRHPDKGYFQTTPVFRIPLEDFTLFNQLRFMERLTNVPKYGPHNVVYEADLADIRVETVGDTAGLQYPMWIMDYLIANNFLERAEKYTKLPGVPELEEDDYASTPELTKLIRETYVQRKNKPANTYAVYSQTKEFKELEGRLAAFDLLSCESKNLGTVVSAKVKQAPTEPLEEIEEVTPKAAKGKFVGAK